LTALIHAALALLLVSPGAQPRARRLPHRLVVSALSLVVLLTLLVVARYRRLHPHDAATLVEPS
jgi:hypothetical protein